MCSHKATGVTVLLTDPMITCHSWCFAGVCVCPFYFSDSSPVTQFPKIIRNHKQTMHVQHVQSFIHSVISWLQVPRQRNAKFALLQTCDKLYLWSLGLLQAVIRM